MRKHLGVLCAITLLTACGTPGLLSKTDENVTEVRETMRTANDTHAATAIGAIEHVDGAWLSKKSVAVNATIALPEFFTRQVRFSTGAPLPMSVLLAQVARGHGLTIRMASDVACDGGASSRDGRGGRGEAAGVAQRFQINCTESGEPAVPLQYHGSLSGLLDTIAHRSGTHWSYRDGVVQFARYVTRTFQIKMMPGSSTYTASVGKASRMKADRGASGGGGTSSGGVDLSFNADANVTVESELDYWTDLVKTVADMLSPSGRVTPSVVTSSLVVTDTADVVERVARYVESENAVLGRQVKLRVQVYSVTLEENSAAGIDWDLVYRSASGFVAGLSGPALGGALMTRKGGLGIRTIPNGRLAGSSAFIKALSKQGRVSTVIDTTVVTLNNQPAPVAVTQNRGFVAQTKMTPGNYGGQAVVTAEQSVLTTGFVMNLLPTLMDNRSVMLQVQIDMSDLKKLDKINLRTGKEAPSGSDAGASGGGSGPNVRADIDGKGASIDIGGKDDDRRRDDDGLGAGTFMQLPITASVQTMQRASLKSGDTLVLSGFRRKDDSTERDGIFNYEGGTKEANQHVNEVVIMISPELTEGV
ncbi:secretin N-terminal domain-containing protein [Pandoraea commovens]|uniref:Secretin N-terminal domain-containing protein n=1 Tax=Pandoraea commovens TaxID=2508289 RepID=A0ABY5QFY6_9BURK|nr:secretin N-terminal domain-containing protein [Pandoraea commovens]UVA79727.1 secretin N-terminal domain-containing protein [Pandoraea commovens]